MTEIETQRIGNIAWDVFESKYVRIEEAEPISLELSNWRQTEEEYKGEVLPGIRTDVLEENGIKKNKTLKFTSKRLAAALKPIFEKAEKMKNSSVKVRIMKTGSGFNTQYSVKEIES